MLCILEPPHAAQHWPLQPDQAGLQLQVPGKGRTSRAATKIKSRKLVSLQDDTCPSSILMLGGRLEGEERDVCSSNEI